MNASALSLKSHPGEGTPGGNTARTEQADAHTCESAKPYGIVGEGDAVAAAGSAAEAPPCGAPGVAPAGGLFSNTPPLNSKNEKILGGEDWLEWVACVDWGDNYIRLHARLLRAKETAQDTKLAKEFGGDMVTFGAWQLMVAPNGSQCGVHYAFRLSGPGLVVLMQDRQRPRDMAPNVIVRSDGGACLQWGGIGCLERGRAVLVAMGATINREMLSRVDLALDMPGVGMGDFMAAYQDRRYITRANARGCHESSGISIYLGKPPLRLRIYDKAAEMKSGCDPLKMYFMIMLRWAGVIPEEAIRVEFELRREALKDHGIDTPDDYFRKRADLAAYLCGEWVRFTLDAVDRTNTTRATILPLWLTVADGFKTWSGEPAGLPLTPLDRGKVDVRQLERQGAGVLLTAAVLSGKAGTVEEFSVYSHHVMACYLASLNWKREVAARMV